MIREGGDPVHALDAKTFNLMSTFPEGVAPVAPIAALGEAVESIKDALDP
jgi:hypothetical protein